METRNNAIFFFAYFTVALTALFHPATASQLCDVPGAVRLVGFDSAAIGNLEVCKGGVWGSVCASLGEGGIHGGATWSRRNSIVACRQLGFEDAVGLNAREGVHFHGNASFPHYGAVKCSGVETELSECETTPPLSSGCGHNGAAFVVCRQPATGDVRLVGSEGESSGIVEVYNSQPGYGWSTICNTGWGEEESKVVCSQLGFKKGAVKLYSSGSVLGWLPWKRYDNFSCTGSEGSLSECAFSGVYAYKCLSLNYAGVSCSDDVLENPGEYLLKVIIVAMLVLLVVVLVISAFLAIRCGWARLKCKTQPASAVARRSDTLRSRRDNPRSSGQRRGGVARVNLADPSTWEELDPSLAPPSYDDTMQAERNQTLTQNEVSSTAQTTSNEDTSNSSNREEVWLAMEDSEDVHGEDSERALLLATSGPREEVDVEASPCAGSGSSTEGVEELGHHAAVEESMECLREQQQQQQDCSGSDEEEGADTRSTAALLSR